MRAGGRQSAADEAGDIVGIISSLRDARLHLARANDIGEVTQNPEVQVFSTSSFDWSGVHVRRWSACAFGDHPDECDWACGFAPGIFDTENPRIDSTMD